MKKALLVILLVLCACTKKKDDDSAAPATVPAPDKAVLTAPASNSTCTTGRVISTTQSAVLFTWNAAINSDNYDLVVKNLLTSTSITQNTTTNQFELTLLRNTPYSWYVVSKSGKTTQTTQSNLFKFYNSGLAATNYAPFPADNLLPAFAQSVTATAGKITLSWTGADVDNDIIGYDIYWGTSATNIALIKSNLTAGTFDVAVIGGTTYYWKIITRDSQANTSSSTIYQFNVN